MKLSDSGISPTIWQRLQFPSSVHVATWDWHLQRLYAHLLAPTCRHLCTICQGRPLPTIVSNSLLVELLNVLQYVFNYCMDHSFYFVYVCSFLFILWVQSLCEWSSSGFHWTFLHLPEHGYSLRIKTEEAAHKSYWKQILKQYKPWTEKIKSGRKKISSDRGHGFSLPNWELGNVLYGLPFFDIQYIPRIEP